MKSISILERSSTTYDKIDIEKHSIIDVVKILSYYLDCRLKLTRCHDLYLCDPKINTEEEAELFDLEHKLKELAQIAQYVDDLYTKIDDAITLIQNNLNNPNNYW